ncbi:MAG TPA: lipopolysaccharide kinase InaA family protein [Candidatus Binataceae bacterium]|nr:lipopolysaccharide kinase InaA family protein [Candidatus Binataceae bacterium]
MSAAGEHLQYAGWSFVLPPEAGEMSEYAREQLIAILLDTVAGRRGMPFKRSARATTWKVQVVNPLGDSINLFIKQLDPMRGWARTKRIGRESRVAHVLAISGQLSRAGFAVPRVLIAASSPTGHEAMVTEQLPGFMLTWWMNPAHGIGPDVRRAILQALGREVAHLHSQGFIHGDLTPYNVFVTSDDPVRIAFLDHERSRRWRIGIGVARQRMRNLVQLGHFALAGVSRSDKLRVLVSYADAMGLQRRKTVRTMARMIQRRLQKDRAGARDAEHAAIAMEEGSAGGR